MKRNISIIISICILMTVLPVNTFSATKSGMPATTFVNTANRELSEDYRVGNNYYPNSINIENTNDNLYLRTNIVDDMNIICYGNAHGDINQGKNRYLGYDRIGGFFPNPNFPNDAWSSTKPLEDWVWIKNPWTNSNVNIYSEASRAVRTPFEYNSILKNGQEVGTKYLQSFIQGLKKKYGAMNVNGKPVLGDKYDKIPWHEYMHVVQPPTMYSDGLAWIFHDIGTERAWYITVPLVRLLDCSVTVLRTGTEDNMGCITDKSKTYTALIECRIDNYDNISTTLAEPQLDVKVNGATLINGGVTMSADYLVERLDQYNALSEEQKSVCQATYTSISGLPMQWLSSVTRDKTYRSATHTPLKSSDGAWFKINTNTGTNPARIAKRYFFVNYVPNSSLDEVTIECNINTGFEDADITNNSDKVKIPISAVTTSEPSKYTLDYDEYSRDFQYAFNEGNEISAKIEQPSSHACSYTTNWSSSSTISTGSTSEALLHSFGQDEYISKNRAFAGNEAVITTDTSVSRKPVFSWNTSRSSYDDDPLKRIYYAIANSEPISLLKSFFVSNAGNSISRPYNYSYFSGCTTTADGEHVHGDLVSGSDTTTDAFETLEKKVFDIAVKVYNGMHLPILDYGIDTNGNTENSTVKTLNWGSKPIQIPVHRWMKNVDKDGNIKDLVKVPGKFDRVFRHINSANITYSVNKSIKDWFSTDINNSYAKKVGNKYYPHAPFATDSYLLRNYLYPLKAGYYCNPGGEYVVTVESIIYDNAKDLNKKSPEHQKLIDNVLANFKYKSNIGYSVKLDDKNAYYVDYPNKENLSVNKYSFDYTTSQRKLEYDDNDVNATDKLYKRVLEGWSESNTLSSLDNYDYREFVTNSNIHKIYERTKIIFKVNENNKKFYTHVKLPKKDGGYYMKAFFEDFNFTDMNYTLNNHNYFEPIWVSGIEQLDRFRLDIVGSMYDDLNNEE